MFSLFCSVNERPRFNPLLKRKRKQAYREWNIYENRYIVRRTIWESMDLEVKGHLVME